MSELPELSTAHPIFQNAKKQWMDRAARVAECYVEVPEWGPEGKAYKLHLRPPKGMSVDQIAGVSRFTQPLEFSIRTIIGSCIDPIERTPIFDLNNDRQWFLDLDDPNVVMRVAGEIISKLSEAYTQDPEKVKNDSSKKEAES